MSSSVGQAERKNDGIFLRASERVLDYLLAEFDQPHLREGSRLPTNKQLAQRLNVSLGTVQSVLRRLADEGRIRTRRGSGTFLVSAPTRRASATPRLGIGIPLESLERPGEWMSSLSSGIFQAVMKNRAILEGISSAVVGTDAILSELRDKQSRLDALILMPYTIALRHECLIADYERSGKPVVHIHQRHLTDTANFVTEDFLGSGHAVGRAWRETGRRRILAIANQRRGGWLGMSQKQRHSGLLAGLAPGFPGAVSSRVCETAAGAPAEEDGYRVLREALEGGLRPDAVFCSEYILAVGAARALREAGFQIPEEVSVVSACGIEQEPPPGDDPLAGVPSHFCHAIKRVGFSAVELAIGRIRRDGIPLPGVIVPAAFVAGTTSRPEEIARIAAYETLEAGRRDAPPGLRPA